MTTRISNTLHETAEAVEVPAIDQIAFQQRVRVARRRRVATRATVAVAASVALAAGAGVVVQLRASDEAGGVASNPGEAVSVEWMQAPVPFVVDGNLMVIPPDGGKPVSTDLEVEEIVGQVADGVIVVADESRVLHVTLDDHGNMVGPARPIIGDDPVQRAVLSKDRSTIGWVDLDERLHLRRLAEPREFHTEQLTPPAQLASVAEDSWLVLPAPGKPLRLATADDSVELHAQEEPDTGEIASRTVAAEGPWGTQFFSVPSGDPINEGAVGGTAGALSPDGSTYVAGASEDEVDQGMSAELLVFDVQTGKHREIPVPDELRFTRQIVWTGTNFLVSGGDGQGEQIHECSAEALTCRLLYDGQPGQVLWLATN